MIYRTILALLLLCASPAFAMSPSLQVLGAIQAETAAYSQIAALTNAQQKVVDTNIKLIKYGSGITLSAVTMNLSTVDGTAFLTNPSVDLRPYLGFKVSIQKTGDATKTLVAWARAAGTGEAYTEMSPDPTFSNAAAWTSIDTWVVGGGSATLVNPVNPKSINYNTDSQVGKLIFGSITVTSSIAGVSLGASSASSVGAINFAGTGVKSFYATAINTTTTDIRWVNTAAGTGTLTMTANSWKHVLTPSTLGVTLYNAQSGGVQSAVSNNGLDSNGASYVITITRN